MKSILKVLLFAVAITMCLSAFGANSGDVTLRKDSTLGKTTLPAGSYKVTVDGKGADVKITFAQGKKVVATAIGTLKEATVAPEFSAVVVDANSGNSISEIRLAKLKGAVVVNP